VKLLITNYLGRFPSSLRAVERIVGSGKWRELMLTTPDWRDLYGKAAYELNLDELSLMAEVARRIGVPFVGRVSDIEIEKPTDRDIALGSLPIRRGDQVIGIITIEPTKARFVCPGLRFEQIFLSSWSLIKEKLSNNVIEKAVARDQRAMMVLNAVIGQAEEQDCFRVGIDWLGEDLQYSLPLRSGEQASGQIMSGVASEFVEFLEIKCREGGVVMSETPVTMSRSGTGFQIDIGKGISKEREIWVIEDDASCKRVLDIYLRGKGISVRGFKSAEIALRELRQSLLAPRVILTDEHLPRMKGSDFVRTIRSEPIFSGIDLIVYTSDYTVQTRINSIKAGAFVCLDKTEDPEILLAYLEQTLNKVQPGDAFLRSV